MRGQDDEADEGKADQTTPGKRKGYMSEAAIEAIDPAEMDVLAELLKPYQDAPPERLGYLVGVLMGGKIAQLLDAMTRTAATPERVCDVVIRIDWLREVSEGLAAMHTDDKGATIKLTPFQAREIERIARDYRAFSVADGAPELPTAIDYVLAAARAMARHSTHGGALKDEE